MSFLLTTWNHRTDACRSLFLPVLLLLSACAQWAQTPSSPALPAGATYESWISHLLLTPPDRDRLPLDARVRPLVKQAWEARHGAPLWTRANELSSAGQEALGLLLRAREEGLQPGDYRVEALNRWVQALRSGGGNEARAQVEVGMSLAVAQFLFDVRSGRVPPTAAGVEINVTPNAARVPPLVARVMAGEPLSKVLPATRPPVPLYIPLRKALARYRELATHDAESRLPALRTSLKPGQSWSGVAALARRLSVLGDYAGPAVTGNAYQGTLVTSVKHFQERHGLAPDGVVGGATYDALATPLAWRVRQIELAMERMRWMAKPVTGQPHIVVNIPQFRLWAFPADTHQATLTMAVIVGKGGKSPTPVMQEKIQTIVFSPYWNVPHKIAKNEVVPQLRRDPGYWQSEHLELVSAQGVITQVPSATQLAAVERGELRIRQRPGDENALGGVKFEFPNHYAIYMHDTQTRALFARSRRDFSHGCIRVQHPQALAEFLLQSTPGWSPARINAAMTAGKQERVSLPASVPVLLFYNTSMVALDGRVAFFEDVYGLDKRLDQVLAAR